MIVTERERERGRDTGRGRSRLHAPGARRGIRSRVFWIAPWAKGRRQTAAPPRDPSSLSFHSNASPSHNSTQSVKQRWGKRVFYSINKKKHLSQEPPADLPTLPFHWL
ncbi:hypothetical protein VULLAG_LOCUS13260 [Vulpes lagopus]